MRKRIISMLFVLSAFIVPASVQAQWVVSDPGNLVQGIVNSVNEIVETSETAQNALSTWKETSKIFEQGREYYDKLRKVNDLISGSEKVKESVLMLGDISRDLREQFRQDANRQEFQPAGAECDSCRL